MFGNGCRRTTIWYGNPAREQRGLAVVAALAEETEDPWEEHLDVQIAHAAPAHAVGWCASRRSLSGTEPDPAEAAHYCQHVT
jgi:hypothetical protein